MRLDSLTAEEALRIARATLDCRDMKTSYVDCALVNISFDPFELDHKDLAETREGRHDVVASALLDGFSVDEVTEAGG